MATSIHLSPAVIERVRSHAAAAGVSQSEWMRRAIEAACTQTEYPASTSENHVQTSTPHPGEPIDTTADLRHELTAALARADQAEGIALARLEEIERLRQDLDAERDRTHGAVIESVSIGVRALTTAETTRPTRRTVREWFRDVFRT